MSNHSSGIGLAGLLTVLFVGLKLTSFIDWSWWWVLSPLWISAALVLVIIGVVFAVAGVVAALSRQV